MDKLTKMTLLADFYSPLLTEKQRNVWDLHYQQDLSLAEIAEVEHISRQAIHDLLKRTERILTEYEDKLGLIQRFWVDRQKLMEVKALFLGLSDLDFTNQAARERHQQIRSMIEEVYIGISAV